MGIGDRTKGLLSKDEFGQTIADRMKRAGEAGKVTYDSKHFCIVIEDEDENSELVGQFNLDNVYQAYSPRMNNSRRLATR